MQLLAWKIPSRQSVIADSSRAVIAHGLTPSGPVSGYCEAAGGDASLRDSAGGWVLISGFWFSRAALIRRACYGDGKRGLLR